MCKSPILIRNPNYHINAISQYTKRPNINDSLKDTTFAYIQIPCGRCPQCVALKQCYIVQRTQMEALDNDLYFGTLTYSNKTLPRLNVNGYNLPYADIRDVQCMFKRIRKYKKLPSFRYMVVTEYGTKKHRPHFHFILSIKPEVDNEPVSVKVSRGIKIANVILSEWKRNIGSTRSPNYVNLCDYKVVGRSRNFDCHYVNPSLSSGSTSDVAFYVSKYIMKSSKYVDSLRSALFYNTPDYDSFKELWKYFRPRVLLSKGYGNVNSDKVFQHIRKSIEFGLSSTTFDYPVYCNPVSAQTFPLCPYFRKKFLTLLDSFGFFYKSDSPFSNGANFTEDYDPSDILLDKEAFERTQIMVDKRDSDLSYLFDYTDDNDFSSFIEGYEDESIKFKKLSIKDFEDYESDSN